MLYSLSLYVNTAGACDLSNLLTGPALPLYLLPLGQGLTVTLGGISAKIGGTAVTAAPATHAFAPSLATYRDLNPDGTWTFVTTAVSAAAPPVTPGALRVGVSVASSTALTEDSLLCTRFWSLQPTEADSQPDAQTVADSLAAQLQAMQGGTWVGVAAS